LFCRYFSFNCVSLHILLLQQPHAQFVKNADRVHVCAVFEAANCGRVAVFVFGFVFREPHAAPPICWDVNDLSRAQFHIHRFNFIKIGAVLGLC
jgi:hypothetical protein